MATAWRSAAVVASAAAATLGTGCSAPAPAGRVLVTSGFTDQIFLLDAATGAVVDSVSLDRRPGERDEPHAVAVAPDGLHWYATISHGEPTLWKFETEGNRLVGRLTVPTTGASRVRLSPDGRLAAVPDYWLGGGGQVSRVAVIRTQDLSVVGAPEVCAAPHDAVFSPDGARLAVTCALGDEVVILDAGTLTEIARHGVEETASSEAGPRPMNAAWVRGGAGLAVTLMGRASVVELAEDGRRTTVSVGARPAQIELSPDGRFLVVANRGDRTVSIVPADGGSGRRVEIPGAHPHGVAFGPDPRVAYVSYEGDVESAGGAVAIEVETGRILWHTPAGLFTLGVAWLPD